MNEVTQILSALQAGDPKAATELLPLVYEELRKLAAHRMANEPPGQTLQATALVHEAWLRLVSAEQQTWQNRAHFFGAAAEAMRRILVDIARRKRSLKRGVDFQRIDWENLDVAAASNDETVLAVHEALDKLAARDATAAEVIERRFFGGLSNANAAKTLGLPERTAKRKWAYARAWLQIELKRNS